MFRFDRLIRSDMTMRDIKRHFPQTVAVFETFGFREICDDCAVEIIARRSGLSSVEVVDALNRAAFERVTEKGEVRYDTNA